MGGKTYNIIWYLPSEANPRHRIGRPRRKLQLCTRTRCLPSCQILPEAPISTSQFRPRRGTGERWSESLPLLRRWLLETPEQNLYRCWLR